MGSRLEDCLHANTTRLAGVRFRAEGPLARPRCSDTVLKASDASWSGDLFGLSIRSPVPLPGLEQQRPRDSMRQVVIRLNETVSRPPGPAVRVNEWPGPSGR